MKKRAQVWIETVLYLLIGLSLIGTLLYFSIPKINEQKDRTIIEQSKTALAEMDILINSVVPVAGNSRELELSIKRGDLYISASNDKIMWKISEVYGVYSQPGLEIPDGRNMILTELGKKRNTVYLTLSYGNTSINIQNKGEEIDKKITQSPRAYRLIIESLSEKNVSIREI